MGREDVWDGDAGTPNTGTRDLNNYRRSPILDVLKSLVSRPKTWFRLLSPA